MQIGRRESCCKGSTVSRAATTAADIGRRGNPLEAIGADVGDEFFAQLEAMLLSFAPAWEEKWRGISSFNLLSALPEARLSTDGRKRLGELRRNFEQEQPTEPMGITVGTVGSPIPQAAAAHMTDEQWMAAIAKYSTGERWSRIELVGDAEELAQVLEAETKLDAERFASLALRFTSETHPAYTNAVLRAVGDPEASYRSKVGLRPFAPRRPHCRAGERQLFRGRAGSTS